MIRDRDDMDTRASDRDRATGVFDGEKAKLVPIGDVSGEVGKSVGRERFGRVVFQSEQFAMIRMAFRSGRAHEGAGASTRMAPGRRNRARVDGSLDEGDLDHRFRFGMDGANSGHVRILRANRWWFVGSTAHRSLPYIPIHV